jgi:8-oxo-dGTP pyrophosphatase MutT (NUDIX family)
MQNSIINPFIDYFSQLSEKEQFQLQKIFQEKTGGKLSPYNNPTPVAVALLPVQKENNIFLLGVRRGIEPFIGGLSLPGGFQDFMENADDAVVREVFEETGLQTQPEDYIIYGKPLLAPNNNQLIFFKHTKIFDSSIMNQLTLNSEVLDFELIHQNSEICFPLHKMKINHYFQNL